MPSFGVPSPRVLVLAALSLCAPTSGQDAAAPAERGPKLSELSLEDLMALPVSAASNVASEQTRQPSSITIVTRSQIVASGAQTLSAVLMTWVPGYFLVEDQDDTIAAFRGFSPDNNSKVLLLLNGHPINTEWFWGPSDAVLNGIALEHIERIEVVRGPGSVTLGAGALLGVVNVITRERGVPSAMVSAGQDGWRQGYLELGGSAGDVRTMLSITAALHDGQPLRREGWARDRVAQGVSVADRGHRLGRADNRTLVAGLGWRAFNLQVLHTDQVRDLYNFFRDREEVQQTLTSLALSWRRELAAKQAVQVSGSFDVDDYDLLSHSGILMGGTRERRLGLRAVYSSGERLGRHRLAAGVEARRFESGRRNRNGNNFIVNFRELAGQDPNASHTWVYESDLDVIGLFAEDFVKLGSRLEAFGAFRLDHHPNWGTRLTPRIGLLAQPSEDWHLRLSWQTGFRGAVGVHYAGGFRLDGLLREENFGLVETNPQLRSRGFRNVAPTKPEELSSLELAAQWMPSPRLGMEAVVFANEARNVIDVGVLFVDPAEQVLTEPLGTDVAGDWNGFFYFKNNPGSIRQYGAEATLRVSGKGWTAQASHALVRVQHADQGQFGGSMYLAGTPADPHFKGYPEDVTRLHGSWSPTDRVTLAGNYLYYWRWFSPTNQEGRANHLVSALARVRLGDRVEVDVTGRNLLNQQRLYPMNNNTGDAALAADGTPGVASRSVRVAVRLGL